MSMRNPLGGSGKGYTLFPGQAILCFRVPAALDIASGLHATRSWREDGEADKVQEEEKREQELRLEEEGVLPVSPLLGTGRQHALSWWNRKTPQDELRSSQTQLGRTAPHFSREEPEQPTPTASKNRGILEEK